MSCTCWEAFRVHTSLLQRALTAHAPHLLKAHTLTYPPCRRVAPTLQVLDVEVVMLNEFLGAYPNYVTGVSTCPFFAFKRYQFNKDQHYSFAGTTPQQPAATYPYPTEAGCTTPQPPQQLPCPAMVSLGRHCWGQQTRCDNLHVLLPPNSAHTQLPSTRLHGSWV